MVVHVHRVAAEWSGGEMGALYAGVSKFTNAQGSGQASAASPSVSARTWSGVSGFSGR